MKAVRIKIKTLGKALIVLVSLGLIIYALLPGALMRLADRQLQKGNRAEAHGYYQRIIKYFLRHGEAAMAMEWLAQGIEGDNYLMISPMGFGGTGGYGEETGTIPKETIALYEKLVQLHPETPHGQRAMVKLAIRDIYGALKEKKYKESMDIIANLEEKLLPRSAFQLQRVYLFTLKELSSRGYFQEAIEFGEKYIKSMEMDESSFYYDEGILETLADTYLMMGNGDRAKEIYKGIIDDIRKNQLEIINLNEADEGLKYDNIYEEERIENLENKIRIADGDGDNSGRISGTVTLHGEALANTNVFLQPISAGGGFPTATRRALWLKSNEKGEFTFKRLPPGKYALGLIADLNIIGDSVLKEGRFPQSNIEVEAGGSYSWSFDFVETIKVHSPINNSVVEEEIHFSWQPVEGAAYYTLEIGRYFGNGSSSNNLPEKYYQTNTTLSANALLQLDGGLSYSEEEGVIAESFMNYPYPGSRHFWGVVAYDEEDQIISSTLGYIKGQNTDFTFKGHEPREADKLLAAGDYEGAIEAYEGDLEGNPEDLYAMIILARLYRNDIEDIYPYSNLSRARELYERLYDLTGNEVFLQMKK
ncbi:carboxypeptidase regulatory-like domain-containing protein [Alkaliphilus serpentinus]|uniref:Carboxypeptidase regulatory-like domain-containing protein n=1 Tax=Alkaliphilus serpentinus TaxID=1482731 RepID=A0A833HN47_9FIRM|nr:carboxypeptidase regulatory-like domain-containing protein [Alkaliphilus serpentinus]KAB3529208.1 hypothetical protein F8153_09800 [Alkaliphilus serpentinus]